MTAVRILDLTLQVIAWALRRFTPVAGAGAFWITTGAPFLDAWREPGAYTVRAGRLELVVDWRA